MKYGYARVSTLHQDLEAQLQALKKEGCDKIYADKFTGTKTDRPEFNKLLNVLKEGDTLVVTKLDRFARTTADGINTVKSLFEKGIKVHVLNMGLIEDTPTGRLILSVMLAFAEFERDMIVERTQEGKALAKQKTGFREGRPKKYSKKQIEHALKLLENHSYKQVTEMTGISKSTLIRAKGYRSFNAMPYVRYDGTNATHHAGNNVSNCIKTSVNNIVIVLTPLVNKDLIPFHNEVTIDFKLFNNVFPALIILPTKIT